MTGLPYCLLQPNFLAHLCIALAHIAKEDIHYIGCLALCLVEDMGIDILREPDI